MVGEGGGGLATVNISIHIISSTMSLRGKITKLFEDRPSRLFNSVDLLQVSLAEKAGEKKRERLVILGMLINIHELSSLASIFKMAGLLSTVSSKLESAIVKEHSRASLCCIIVLARQMIGYLFFVKGCRLDRILSSQRQRLPSITSLSRFYSFSHFCRERDL